MKKKCVFLVDDHKNFLESFKIEAQDDWDLYTFESPMLALESIAEKSPSVFISDIQMNDAIHGANLLDIVSMISNKIKLVAISGFSKEYISSNFGFLSPDVHFFIKPLNDKSFNEIAQIINESEELDLSQERSFEYVDTNLGRLKDILYKINKLEKRHAEANIAICFLALGLSQEDGKKLALKLGVAL